eukprot:tig00020684_g12887.t1
MSTAAFSVALAGCGARPGSHVAWSAADVASPRQAAGRVRAALGSEFVGGAAGLLVRSRAAGSRVFTSSRQARLGTAAPVFQAIAPPPGPIPETDPENVSVILLAGGVGKRMGASMPKQFLPLQGRPIVLHSLELFQSLRPNVFEIVIVCDPSSRHYFEEAVKSSPVPIKYALPGKERQDSVYNGLQEIDWNRSQLVAVHDSARPLVERDSVRLVFREGAHYGAAALGVPSKATIKEVDPETRLVERTPDRSRLYEIQTPQVIRPKILQAGYDKVHAGDTEGKPLAVTDDLSIVELLGGHPVRITMGEYTNLKITTPEDMVIAESILADRAASPASA